jgi:hypothetical protein
MRGDHLMRALAVALLALAIPVGIAWSEDGPAPDANVPAAGSATTAPEANPPTGNPAVTPPEAPAVTILNNHEVQGVLGREVRDAADDDMGRIIDVLVDRSGEVRAAIIDFGGFLGVGSRKIAVDWNALHFPVLTQSGARITLELTRDQVKAAPEYQDGKPVVVLGSLGKLEPLPFE